MADTGQGHDAGDDREKSSVSPSEGHVGAACVTCALRLTEVSQPPSGPGIMLEKPPHPQGGRLLAALRSDCCTIAPAACVSLTIWNVFHSEGRVQHSFSSFRTCNHLQSSITSDLPFPHRLNSPFPCEGRRDAPVVAGGPLAAIASVHPV